MGAEVIPILFGCSSLCSSSAERLSFERLVIRDLVGRARASPFGNMYPERFCGKQIREPHRVRHRQELHRSTDAHPRRHADDSNLRAFTDNAESSDAFLFQAIVKSVAQASIKHGCRTVIAGMLQQPINAGDRDDAFINLQLNRCSEL